MLRHECELLPLSFTVEELGSALQEEEEEEEEVRCCDTPPVLWHAARKLAGGFFVPRGLAHESGVGSGRARRRQQDGGPVGEADADAATNGGGGLEGHRHAVFTEHLNRARSL